MLSSSTSPGFLSTDFPLNSRFTFIWPPTRHLHIGHLKISMLKIELRIPSPLPIAFTILVVGNSILMLSCLSQDSWNYLWFHFASSSLCPLRNLLALLSNIFRIQSPYNCLWVPGHSGPYIWLTHLLFSHLLHAESYEESHAGFFMSFQHAWNLSCKGLFSTVLFL